MKRVILKDVITDYLISKNGEVFSLKNKRFLKGDISSGYKRFVLCINSEKKRFTAHFLVANAFLPNPNNYPIIHHKDGDRLNNNLDNLEWISYVENSKKENKKSLSKIDGIHFSEKELATEQ